MNSQLSEVTSLGQKSSFKRQRSKVNYKCEKSKVKLQISEVKIQGIIVTRQSLEIKHERSKFNR